MSYVFDVLEGAFRYEIAPSVKDHGLVSRFEFLLHSIHEANHRLGDAINRDSRVVKDATELDEYLKKQKEQKEKP